MCEAREKARAMVVAWREEREAAEKRARRRHKASAAERAYELEYRPLSALEAQIIQTPAEGLAGIAIKLALCKHYYFDTWSFSHDTLATACETMAKIQGVDLSAQVECW